MNAPLSIIAQADPGAGYRALKPEIDAAVARALNSGWYILGQEGAAFEREYGAWLGEGVRAVGCANGTDAIALILRGMGIGEGSTVVTVSHTAVATVAAIEMAGATPLLLDIDPDTYCMDADELAAVLHDPPPGIPPIRAVVAVHIYGHPCDLGPMLQACATAGVPLIEDCAQAHGARLGVAPDRLLVPYQIHSADCLAVAEPWTERPRCDALATATPGLALGVTGADCGVMLFRDARAGVVGAAHAGWKGALDGVIGATVARMCELGARRADIHVALGPTIGPASYEVGPEFVARFKAASPDYARFFAGSSREGHARFDLPAFIGLRAEQAGVGAFNDLALDTYADPRRFFSYRRATHEGAADYGRLVAAIVL